MSFPLNPKPCQFHTTEAGERWQFGVDGAWHRTLGKITILSPEISKLQAKLKIAIIALRRIEERIGSLTPRMEAIKALDEISKL